jgi:beta-glucosidase
MSAHLRIPALDADYPATLSPKVLTETLRQKLGFEGLVSTDALNMGAIANNYGTAEACVLAVEAGADILLMPLEPEKAIQAVCEAVESGRISRDRIQASVERIWRSKLKVCVAPTGEEDPHAWENLPAPALEPQRLTQQIGQADAIATNAEMLLQSMKVYLPSPSRLDQKPEQGRNLILVDDLVDCDFLNRTAPAIVLPQQFGFSQVEIVDRHTPTIHFDNQTKCPTLLQLFIRGNPFRGIAGLTKSAQNWFEFLLQTDQLQAIVLYGSPYVLDQFVPKLPADVPYVFTFGQMQSAQAIAIDTLF